MKIYIKKTPTASFETIDVKDDPLGKGGQGAVHNIRTSQYSDYCVKIFKEAKNAAKEYNRIAFMVQNPPQNIMGSPSFRICWPIALAYDSNKTFVGYVMPLAFPKSRDLLILSTFSAKPMSAQRKYAKFADWHNKYELTTTHGIKNRIKMLHNWALAMYFIHETKKYVLIDLKPENVMATADGKISVVDTDSFQIAQGDKILFPATAFTPGYYAPEFIQLKNSGRAFPESCDRFAAAVCFYKILIGTHPYSGTVLKPPYDKCETEQECIDNNLFAFGDKSQYFTFCKGLNPHENFKNLPATVQSLFKRAFGSNPNNRPSMAEWGKVLHEAAGDSVSIAASTVKPASTNAPSIRITKVTFCSTDQPGNIVTPEGNTLYNNIQYLNPIVYYNVLKTGGDLTIWYKVISPSGRLIQGNNAPDGFTWKGTVNRSSTGSKSSRFGGIGNSAGNHYEETGTWKVEFYDGDKCIFSTMTNISPKFTRMPPTPKPTPPPTPKPTPTPTPRSYTPYTRTSKKTWWERNRAWVITSAVALILGVIGYIFLFQPWYFDKQAPKYYVISNSATMVDHNAGGAHINDFQYGTQIAMHEDRDGGIVGRTDGEIGYMSKRFLVPEEDFKLLDGALGDDNVLNTIHMTRYRKAILDFIKQNNFSTGFGGYKLIMPSAAEFPNTIMISHEENGYDKYREFAFILTDTEQNKAKAAIYSFDENENPVLVHSEDCAPNKMITNISCSRKNKWSIYYANRKSSLSDRARATKAQIEVSDIEFANGAKDGSLLSSFGTPLNSEELRFLKTKIQYTGLRNKKATEVRIKIYEPNTKLAQGSSSPRGYSFTREIGDVEKAMQMTKELGGWGAESVNYDPGEHIVEIWNNGVKVASKSLFIHAANGSDEVVIGKVTVDNTASSASTVNASLPSKNNKQTKNNNNTNANSNNSSNSSSNSSSQQTKPQQPAIDNNDNTIYSSGVTKAQFPGGESALLRYINSHVKYPQDAINENAQGTVYVKFVVTKTGEIGQVNITRGVHHALDAEAKRVCQSLPRFTPAVKDGKNVNCWYEVPIKFKLQ